MDLQRDFSVASPAEFVTRFGGNRVIEKVCPHTSLLVPGQGLTAFHRDTFEHCPNVLCPPGSEQWQPRAVHSMASLAPMGWERDPCAAALHKRWPQSPSLVIPSARHQRCSWGTSCSAGVYNQEAPALLHTHALPLH